MSHKSRFLHCFYRHYSFTSLETSLDKAVFLKAADISKVYSVKILTLDTFILEYMHPPVHAELSIHKQSLN